MLVFLVGHIIPEPFPNSPDLHQVFKSSIILHIKLILTLLPEILYKNLFPLFFSNGLSMFFVTSSKQTNKQTSNESKAFLVAGSSLAVLRRSFLEDWLKMGREQCGRYKGTCINLADMTVALAREALSCVLRVSQSSQQSPHTASFMDGVLTVSVSSHPQRKKLRQCTDYFLGPETPNLLIYILPVWQLL